MTNNIFCVDCKHHKKEFLGSHNLCFATGKVDLVTGKVIPSFCDIQRTYNHSDTCGTDGKLFEKKIGFLDRFLLNSK